MKKLMTLLFVMLALLNTLNAENGMVMQESDWLHLSIPAGSYVIGNQLLISSGVDQGTAKFITLGLGVGCVFAHEYYFGVGTKEDIELGLMSLASGWVFSECINCLFRGK